MVITGWLVAHCVEEQKKKEERKKAERIEKMKEKRKREGEEDEWTERDYDTAYRWKEKYKD